MKKSTQELPWQLPVDELGSVGITIANILKENGINPAPERDAHTRWSTFLKAHWECLTATDFLSVEVLTIKGLVTHYVLFFIEIASRSVHIAGITPHPDSSWMAQIARNITDANEGFLRGGRNLILDRDAKYTEGFRHALTREGVRLIRLPARSPNLNAFAERFVRSIKEGCLSRMIFLGQASLRHAIAQYLIHYHGERNHRGLENRIPEPNFGRESGQQINRRIRLGGMLSYYHRLAA
jgi:putative transposase